jgi:hypothetical protein
VLFSLCSAPPRAIPFCIRLSAFRATSIPWVPQATVIAEGSMVSLEGSGERWLCIATGRLWAQYCTRRTSQQNDVSLNLPCIHARLRMLVGSPHAHQAVFRTSVRRLPTSVQGPLQSPSWVLEYRQVKACSRVMATLKQQGRDLPSCFACLRQALQKLKFYLKGLALSPMIALCIILVENLCTG